MKIHEEMQSNPAFWNGLNEIEKAAVRSAIECGKDRRPMPDVAAAVFTRVVRQYEQVEWPKCTECGGLIETDVLDDFEPPNLCNVCYHGDSLDEDDDLDVTETQVYESLEAAIDVVCGEDTQRDISTEYKRQIRLRHESDKESEPVKPDADRVLLVGLTNDTISGRIVWAPAGEDGWVGKTVDERSFWAGFHRFHVNPEFVIVIAPETDECFRLNRSERLAKAFDNLTKVVVESQRKVPVSPMPVLDDLIPLGDIRLPHEPYTPNELECMRNVSYGYIMAKNQPGETVWVDEWYTCPGHPTIDLHFLTNDDEEGDNYGSIEAWGYRRDKTVEGDCEDEIKLV